MGIKTKLAQFVCPFCGKGFEQKSKIQRHKDTFKLLTLQLLHLRPMLKGY